MDMPEKMHLVLYLQQKVLCLYCLYSFGLQGSCVGLQGSCVGLQGSCVGLHKEF